MMRMLYRGGIDAFAENRLSFEHEAVLDLPESFGWMDWCKGKAVKILEPLHYRPPKGYRYRFILMSRNHAEQAASQEKFMAAMTGLRIDRKALSRSFDRDYPKMVSLLKGYGAPLIEISFESVILAPVVTAIRVAEFCGLPALAAKEMAACIVPRGPRNYKGLLELKIEEEGQVSDVR